MAWPFLSAHFLPVRQRQVCISLAVDAGPISDSIFVAQLKYKSHGIHRTRWKLNERERERKKTRTRWSCFSWPAEFSCSPISYTVHETYFHFFFSRFSPFVPRLGSHFFRLSFRRSALDFTTKTWCCHDSNSFVLLLFGWLFVCAIENRKFIVLFFTSTFFFVSLIQSFVFRFKDRRCNRMQRQIYYQESYWSVEWLLCESVWFDYYHWIADNEQNQAMGTHYWKTSKWPLRWTRVWSMHRDTGKGNGNAFVRRMDFGFRHFRWPFTHATFRDLDPLTPIKNPNNAIHSDIRA